MKTRLAVTMSELMQTRGLAGDLEDQVRDLAAVIEEREGYQYTEQEILDQLQEPREANYDMALAISSALELDKQEKMVFSEAFVFGRA